MTFSGREELWCGKPWADGSWQLPTGVEASAGGLLKFEMITRISPISNQLRELTPARLAGIFSSPGNFPLSYHPGSRKARCPLMPVNPKDVHPGTQEHPDVFRCGGHCNVVGGGGHSSATPSVFNPFQVTVLLTIYLCPILWDPTCFMGKLL